MKCSMQKYVSKAMAEEYFIKDFYDEIKKDHIGPAYEKNIDSINLEKYERTVESKTNHLFLSDKRATTEITVYYTRQNYRCSCTPHKTKQDAILLFGAKHNDGHLFGICTSCLLKLSLILLKYYKYGELYKYRNNDCIRLEQISNSSECYTCRKNDHNYYRLTFNKKSITLCKSCLDKFTEEILSSPTVKNLFYVIAHEFEKSRNVRKR